MGKGLGDFLCEEFFTGSRSLIRRPGRDLDRSEQIALRRGIPAARCGVGPGIGSRRNFRRGGCLRFRLTGLVLSDLVHHDSQRLAGELHVKEGFNLVLKHLAMVAAALGTQ